MARSNLPGNILKSLNTRLLGDLAHGIQKQQTVANEQLAGVEQGVDDFSKIRAQDIIGDLQVRTGNPVLDMQKRQEVMDKFKEAPGFANKGMVNRAFKDISQQAPKDYIQEWAAADEYKNQLAKQADLKGLEENAQLKPSQSKTFLESYIKEGTSKGFPLQKVKDQYKKQYNQYKYELHKDTKDLLDGLEATPGKYNKAQHHETRDIIARRLQEAFPGITDFATHQAKAGTILDNSIYGQRFKRRMDEEKKETVDDVAMKGITSTISKNAIALAESTTDKDRANAHKAYKDSINVGIRYLNTHNVKSELAKPIETAILGGLQKDSLTLDRLFVDEAAALKFGLTKKEFDKYQTQLKNRNIDTDTAAEIQQKMLRHYRKEYPELTDGIFQQHFDKLKNLSGNNIAFAMQQGREIQTAKAEKIDADRKSKFKYWNQLTDKLNRMYQKDGVVGTIANELRTKFRERFKDTIWDGDTDRSFLTAVNHYVDTMDQNIGKLLIGENGVIDSDTQDAYHLALSRTALNSFIWDPAWGGWKWINAGPGTDDFGVGKEDPRKVDMYTAFKRNLLVGRALPLATNVPKADDLRKGNELLATTINNVLGKAKGKLTVEKEKNQAKTDLLVGQPPKTMNPGNTNNFNKLANQGY